jgi:hypothetical protein
MLVGHPQSPFCGWTSAGNQCVIGLTGEPAAMSLRGAKRRGNPNHAVRANFDGDCFVGVASSQ